MQMGEASKISQLGKYDETFCRQTDITSRANWNGGIAKWNIAWILAREMSFKKTNRKMIKT